MTIPLTEAQVKAVTKDVYEHFKFLIELRSTDMIIGTSKLKERYPFLTNRAISENGGYKEVLDKLWCWEQARLKRARRHKVLI